MVAFLRRAKNPNDSMVVVCNFTPVVRENYRIGVPTGGFYREIFNTDAEIYGGSNVGNQGGVWGVPEPHAGRPFHLSLRVPPLRCLVPQDAVGLLKARARRVRLIVVDVLGKRGSLRPLDFEAPRATVPAWAAELPGGSARRWRRSR